MGWPHVHYSIGPLQRSADGLQATMRMVVAVAIAHRAPSAQSLPLSVDRRGGVAVQRRVDSDPQSLWFDVWQSARGA
jgi:hypothetical protein